MSDLRKICFVEGSVKVLDGTLRLNLLKNAYAKNFIRNYLETSSMSGNTFTFVFRKTFVHNN